jgi:hypothetical protein
MFWWIRKWKQMEKPWILALFDRERSWFESFGFWCFVNCSAVCQTFYPRIQWIVWLLSLGEYVWLWSDTIQTVCGMNIIQEMSPASVWVVNGGELKCRSTILEEDGLILLNSEIIFNRSLSGLEIICFRCWTDWTDWSHHRSPVCHWFLHLEIYREVEQLCNLSAQLMNWNADLNSQSALNSWSQYFIVQINLILLNGVICIPIECCSKNWGSGGKGGELVLFVMFLSEKLRLNILIESDQLSVKCFYLEIDGFSVHFKITGRMMSISLLYSQTPTRIGAKWGDFFVRESSRSLFESWWSALCEFPIVIFLSRNYDSAPSRMNLRWLRFDNIIQGFSGLSHLGNSW